MVYQKDGETLFVPSGWFHQVENIGATISINHNWSNSTNAYLTFKSLSNDFAEVKRSIEDLKECMTPDEFMKECQQLLLMHSGWNWSIFLHILHYIASEYITDCDYQPSVHWQMERVGEILADWVSNEGEELLNYFKQDPTLFQKFNELQSLMNKKI